MIELILIAQVNMIPTGVNSNPSNNTSSSNSNVITRPAPANRHEFKPPVQNPNFVPKLQVEPFPKQPSLGEYLELQRRQGNEFGVPRERLDRRY
jgi:hypothetical protein